MFSTGGIYLHDTFRWMAKASGPQRIYRNLQWARKNLSDYLQLSASSPEKPGLFQAILSWTRKQSQGVLTWWRSAPWKEWLSPPLERLPDTVNHQARIPVGERSPAIRGSSGEMQAVKQPSKKIAPIPEMKIQPKGDVKMS